MSSRGGSLGLVLVLTVVVGAAFLVAFGASRGDVQALRFVRAAPHRELDGPRDGPALYAGTISGPGKRHDGGGNAVAARWWWVIERISKNRTQTVCSHQEIDGMVLLDAAGHRAPLRMFDGATDLSLLATGRTDEWRQPLQIDLADQHADEPSEWPADAQRCLGPKRRYVSRSIPVGAHVELLACRDGDALVACPSKPAGVLALVGMERYRSRRGFEAATPFLFAGGLAWILLFASTVRAFAYKKRVIGGVVPEAPR